MNDTNDSVCKPPLSDNLAKVFAHITANHDAFVKRVIEYVRHPSISAQNVGICEVAGILVSMLQSLGFATEAVPTAGHPMVLGRWEKLSGAPTVLLYGHYDVQPP